MNDSSGSSVQEVQKCCWTRKLWRRIALVLSLVCFIGCVLSFYGWMMVSHRDAHDWIRPLERSTGATLFCSVALLMLFVYLQDESDRCFGFWRLFRRRRRRMFIRNINRFFPVRISEMEESRPSLAERFFGRRYGSVEEVLQPPTEAEAVEETSSEDSGYVLPQHHVVQAEIHHPPVSLRELSDNAEITSMRNLFSGAGCNSSSGVSEGSIGSDRIQVGVPIQEPETASVITPGHFQAAQNLSRRRTQSERIDIIESGRINPLTRHGSDAFLSRRLSQNIQGTGHQRRFLASERIKRSNPHP